jgi:hypothetical protein
MSPAASGLLPYTVRSNQHLHAGLLSRAVDVEEGKLREPQQDPLPRAASDRTPAGSAALMPLLLLSSTHQLCALPSQVCR